MVATTPTEKPTEKATDIEAALNRIEQNIANGTVKTMAASRRRKFAARKARQLGRQVGKQTAKQAAANCTAKKPIKQGAQLRVQISTQSDATEQTANKRKPTMQTSTDAANQPNTAPNIVSGSQAYLRSAIIENKCVENKDIESSSKQSRSYGQNDGSELVRNHHNVLRPVFRKPSPITEISLDEHNYPQLDFLMGSLGFLTGSEPHWITWVNPPQWAQGLLRDLSNDAEQLRMLHGDKSHSSFHLFYKSIQAGNSSWVIGPAHELSAKEREILKQAADHFDCRLLLLTSSAAMQAAASAKTGAPVPQTIDLFGDEISDSYFDNQECEEEQAQTPWLPDDAQQQLFAV